MALFTAVLDVLSIVVNRLKKKKSQKNIGNIINNVQYI